MNATLLDRTLPPSALGVLGAGRLSFRPHSPISSHGRRLRLTSAGMLAGGADLHSLGYYSATVCLGSPAEQFDLIVDTGSSITSVPCRQCRSCGEHRGTRFDERASTTVERVRCSRSTAGLTCGRCDRGMGRCEYRVGYVEGSSIRGHVLVDTVRLTHAAAHNQSRGGESENGGTSARIFFGCQTQESGRFREQVADGILGLQEAGDDGHRNLGAAPRNHPRRRRSRLPSVLSALVKQRAASSSFSLCLGRKGGLLLFGGVADMPALEAAGGVVASMVPGSVSRFSLRLLDVLVAPQQPTRPTAGRGVSMRVPRSALNPVVVDSGTSFFFVPSPLWHAIRETLKAAMPSLSQMGIHPLCAQMTQAQRASLPSLLLVFEGLPAAHAADAATLQKPRGLWSTLVRWLQARWQRQHVESERVAPSPPSPQPTRPLVLQPAHYLVEYPSPGGHRRTSPLYCAEIFDNGDQGTVIGASLLRQREVLFDLDAATVAFADADCARLTPRTARLRSSFAFAPCPRTAPRHHRLASNRAGRRGQSHKEVRRRRTSGAAVGG